MTAYRPGARTEPEGYVICTITDDIMHILIPGAKPRIHGQLKRSRLTNIRAC